MRTIAAVFIIFFAILAVPVHAVMDPSFQPSAPYHATFFYLWSQNPNTDGKWGYWTDHSNNPPNTWFSHFIPDPKPTNFDPTNELYSASNYENFKWQAAKMGEAKMEVSIASWWGQGTREDNAFNSIINSFMARVDNPYPNLRWSMYYEDEGFADPDVATIVSDLNHIKTKYSQSPYYFKIGGKPVIFVYAGANDVPGTMTQRWKDANTQVGNYFYVVLKVFPGFANDPNQPSSWHQYAPATRSGSQASYYYVSPGFWLDDGSAERLVRNSVDFENAVKSMVSSNVTWKLIQTWNEWGEGTSVEPGEQVRLNTSTNKDEVDPNGYPFKNLYVDILKRNLPNLEQGLGTGTTITPSPIPTPSPSNIPTFTPPPTGTMKTPDVNRDGMVNILDIGIIIDNYALVPFPNPNADINSDGIVNIIDIGIIIDNYGLIISTATPSPTSVATNNPSASPTPIPSKSPTPSPTISPTPIPTTPPNGSNDPIVFFVGDLVSGSTVAKATKVVNLIKNLITQHPNTQMYVASTGDNEQENAPTIQDYEAYFGTTYGYFVPQNIFKQVRGNHDVQDSGHGLAYATYFGDKSHLNADGLTNYSYNLGSWHLIGLDQLNGSVNSKTLAFLKSDLAANTNYKCQIVYWHVPTYSSGSAHGDSTGLKPINQEEYNAGVDIQINGHDHHYQRFYPINPEGQRNDILGITTFIDGIGGQDGRSGSQTSVAQAASAIYLDLFGSNSAIGTIMFTLHQNSADYALYDANTGAVLDSGVVNCH